MSAGVDNVSAELFQAGREALIDVMTSVRNKISITSSKTSKKAFDREQHEILWAKMRKYNIDATYRFYPFGTSFLLTIPVLKFERLITKTRLFKYIENFTTKTGYFSDQNLDIFLNFSQNKECGYSLEPPRRGGSNEYPQSMLFSKIRKIMCATVNLSFTI